MKVYEVVVVALLVLVMASASEAVSIQNGDFETGDLTGWTTFTTSNGTLGTGFPQVVMFDTDNDGSSSLSAMFRVGEVVHNSTWQGGGIYQDVGLYAGSLTITADIAVLDDTVSGNYQGGLFELLFDGAMVDSHDFGYVALNQAEYHVLTTISAVTAGTHEIRFRMRRPYTQSSVTPRQYIDDVELSGPATIPEPASLALFGTGIAGMLGWVRRRRRKP